LASVDVRTALRIRLLGGFTIWVDGMPIPESAWRLRKAKGLVKLLALADGRRLHREQLIEHLWPESPPEAGANNLHQALHAARRALSAAGGARDELQMKGDVVALGAGGPPWTDVEAFEAAAREARRARVPAAYEAALALYAGDLLADDPFEEWAERRRAALRQEFQSLLLELAALQEATGAHEPAIATLQRLVGLDPTHEPAHRQLMRLLARAGRRGPALRRFEALRTALRRELDAEPDAESERLYREIRSGRFPGPATEARPVRGEGPEDTSARAGAAPAHNLPLLLSSFVGRQREMAAVERLLAANRLVTLTGTGGCGKTRLAIEVAAGARTAYPDGVWLVELAGLSDPGLIAPVAAQVLGVREQPGRAPAEVLADHLQARRLLIVLDNCEHLVAESARLAETLLRACPALAILATSRQPLRVGGETVWRVPSLSIPDPAQPLPAAELARYEAACLFIERAAAVAPGFAATAENAADISRVCYRLDGLPLAIELAAARVPALTVAEIARRLDDRFALLTSGSRTALTRQQTLKATLDWSHDLLNEDERVLLRRLCVFAGGFDLEAAEAVCAGPSLAPAEVLPLLTELVDKSLVAADPVAGAMRYRLLETVREYARARLGEAGETAWAGRRHADYFLELAERAEARLPGPDRARWLDRLEADHDNLRAAFEALLADNARGALRLAASLGQFWVWRGYLGEGQRALEATLACSHEVSPFRAKAFLAVCALTIRHTILPEAAALAEASLAIYRQLGDKAGASRALLSLAAVAWILTEHDRATAHLEESRALAREIASGAGELSALNALAAVDWYAGALEASESRLLESLDLARVLAREPDAPVLMFALAGVDWLPGEGGQMRLVYQETFFPIHEISSQAAAGYVLANLGNLARWRRDYPRARGYLEEALALIERSGDDWGKAQILGRLGNLTLAEGRYAEAEAFLTETLTIRRRIGDVRGVGMTLLNLGDLALRAGDVGRSRAFLEESRTLFQETGDRPGLCGVLGVLARWAMGQGEYDLARACLSEILVAVREMPERFRHAWVLLDLADLERLAGNPRRAAEAIAEAEARFRRLGYAPGVTQCELARRALDRSGRSAAD
jgi:predicted ATPase/DNA-binding SARP family transcriptional activator